MYDLSSVKEMPRKWFTLAYTATIHQIKRLYLWMGSRVHTRYAEAILGILFYFEAICFLPTDPMLALYCVERSDRALRYALIATIGSVLGGITGYCIGAFLWDMAGEQILHVAPIRAIVSPEMFAYLSEQYRKYEWWALLAAGFTPIPYKAATLTAGFCKLSFLPFIACSCIARGTRFFGLAYTIKRYGPQIQASINRYSSVMVGIVVALIVGIVWLLR